MTTVPELDDLAIIRVDGAEIDCTAVETDVVVGVEEIAALGCCLVQPVFGGGLVLLAEITAPLSSAASRAVVRAIRGAMIAGHRIAPERVVLLAAGELARRDGGSIIRAEALKRYRRADFAPIHSDAGAQAPAGVALAPAAPVGPVRDRPDPDEAQSLGEGAGGPPMDIDAVRADVAARCAVDLSKALAAEDLTRFGVDSVGVMSLAGYWRMRGWDVRFAELIEDPTLAAWSRLLTGRGGEPTDQSPLLDPIAMHTGNGPLPRASDSTAPFPLTPVQYAYWLGRADDQQLGGVSAHYYVEFDGPTLDPDRLERAVRALLARQPGLRTRVLDNGTQQVLDRSPWPGLTISDLREHNDDARVAELLSLRAELAHRRLDVDAAELIDLRLSLVPNGSRLHLNVDLIAADVLSIRIMLTELAALYSEPEAALAPLPVDVAGYLATREAQRAVARAADQQYWAARLEDLPGPPDLPLACDPGTIRPVRFRRHSVHIAASARNRLAERGIERGVTLPMVLITAYAEVLAAWSGRQRFLLNIPLFDRTADQPGLDALIGDFTNLLLLDADMSGPVGFAERVAAIQARFRADAAHSEYSGVDVLRDLRRLRPDTALPAPVVFTGAVGMGDLFGPDVRTRLGDPGWSISQTPQIWLDHQVLDAAGGLVVNFDAVEGLFDDGVIEGMAETYEQLITLLTGPDDLAWAAQIPALVPADTQATRTAVNETTAPMSAKALHENFFDHARRAPDRPALLWGLDGEPGSGRWTYGELAGRALHLAGAIAAQAEPGAMVAVQLPKGPDQIAAVLGVLAAGCAYVPIGIDQPIRRREAVLQAAGVRTIVDAEFEVSGATPLPAPRAVAAAETAYVIFTSGSTGTPKGVQETHRAAGNTVEDINERFAVGPEDRVLAVSALDFDLSVYDMFGVLGAGGALVLIDESERREARRWWDLAQAHGVTIWNTVPALLEMLLEGAPADVPTPALPAALRLAMVSGDWVPLDLPHRLAEGGAGRCRLIAMGGATEAAIWSNAFDATGGAPPGWRSIPYGLPLRNQRFRVVDEQGRDRPDQVPGELWIGGVGVAQGYRGDPARTAEKFVTVAGERWYRTGDLGRYRPGGLLEFLGRTDHQVKVRGHRIELGEIESALLSHPAVTAAVAVAFGPGSANGRATHGNTGTQLAGFVVAGDKLDADGLREIVRARLAPYAVPAVLRVVDELPLTANGKVDRGGLIARAAARGLAAQPTSTAPHGVVEMQVAASWAEVLGLESASREDHFVSLGGDSLTATRVVSLLRTRGYPNAGIGALFAAPVLHEFAATLRAESVTESAQRESARLIPGDPATRFEPFPATEVQRAYWLGRSPEFVLGGVGCHWYTEYDGTDVDVLRLELAWNRLIERHAMLRAVFDDEGGQRILRDTQWFAIPEIEAESADGAAELASLRAGMSEQVFNPGCWPLFDIRAVRYGTRTRIGISFDNLVTDAMSIAILYRELDTLYRDSRAALDPIEISFRDYVLGVRPNPDREQAARDYWQRRVPELPPPPDLPLAADPAEIGMPRFTRRETFVPAAQWQRICATARRHGLTPSSVLATAFAEVLAAWSGQPRMTLTVTLFDRRPVHPDVNAVVGDFTSLLLLECAPAPGDDWAGRARHLQTQMAADLEHSDVPATWVLREQARRSGVAAAGAPIVFTSTIGMGTGWSLDRAFGDRVWGLSQTPQVWLDHQATEVDGGLSLVWDAVEDLFAPGMLDEMFAEEQRILVWLAESEHWGGSAPATSARAVAGTRAADRAVAAPSAATGGGPPEGPLEEQLAALFTDILELSAVGRDDNFVVLGGDSLAATRLMRRVREATAAEVPLRAFFVAPTVRGLAEAVQARAGIWMDEAEVEEGTL